MKNSIKLLSFFLILFSLAATGFSQRGNKKTVLTPEKTLMKDLPPAPPDQSEIMAMINNSSAFYNVRNFGAKGDSATIDSDAIDKTIEAASKAGGGTVWFPAGKYLSYSIHLKSNITLFLDNGVYLIAAATVEGKGGYDAPEPNAFSAYQDFGHSHWHNSLILGENLENIAITGNGWIIGSGLQRMGRETPGLGNKAIALKFCRNVTIKDITILTGGHFCILATGVDNMTIDNLKVDTNRDAFDIDCCRHVRVSNCSVNSPFDDAIVLKSSYALGEARSTEDVTITNCSVSGFDTGTFLDGTYQRKNFNRVPDRGAVTGRIKFGTESNGGFKNITIANCTFEFCRGLALETVDGAILEDITVTNITMRDCMASPFFIRLGARLRGPEGSVPGKARRINISNVISYSADPNYASLILGMPGYDVEDIKMNNITILVKGGAPKEQAEITVPDNDKVYPDPQNFGKIPAYGFFIRHVTNIEMINIELKLENEDFRPAFILDDVRGASFINIKADHAKNVPTFLLKNVTDFKTLHCGKLPDKKIDKTVLTKF
jgi:polygalacturonase